MTIEVLGTNCPNCQAFYQRVVSIVSKITPGIVPGYINDFSKIIKIGAMSSPVLVKNGKLLLVGDNHSDNDIVTALLQDDYSSIKHDDAPSAECSICSNH